MLTPGVLVLTSIGKKGIIRKNGFYLENKLPTPTLASILKSAWNIFTQPTEPA